MSRSVSLECVAGSHRWNTAGYRPKRFDGCPLHADEQFEDVLDIEAQRDQRVIRGWDMAPGDAIAFGSAPMRFEQPGASGSPLFPHLTLKDGAPLDAAEFPLVYGR